MPCADNVLLHLLGYSFKRLAIVGFSVLVCGSPPKNTQCPAMLHTEASEFGVSSFLEDMCDIVP